MLYVTTKIVAELLYNHSKCLGEIEILQKGFRYIRTTKFEEMAKCLKVPNVSYRFRHSQKSKLSMSSVFFREKKTEIQIVFQRDRDSKESMQTIIFFFLSKEYF